MPSSASASGPRTPPCTSTGTSTGDVLGRTEIVAQPSVAATAINDVSEAMARAECDGVAGGFVHGFVGMGAASLPQPYPAARRRLLLDEGALDHVAALVVAAALGEAARVEEVDEVLQHAGAAAKHGA